MSAGLFESLESRNLFSAVGLDASFGKDGQVLTSIAGGVDPNQAIFQTDGKILVGGGYFSSPPQSAGSTSGLFLARYTAAGNLDPTFNKTGIVEIQDNPANSGLYTDVTQMIETSSGKLLVLATDSTGTFVARFTSDGQVDQSFGDAGRVTLTDSTLVNFTMALAPNGKVVLAAENDTGPGTYAPPSDTGGFMPDIIVPPPSVSNVTVMRFNANGTADNSFGNHGTTDVKTLLGHEQPSHVLVLNNNKILISGLASDAVSYATTSPELTRLTSRGNLDRTFANHGKIIGPFVGSIIQTPGNGYVSVAEFAGNQYQIARINASGKLDPHFASKGIATVNLPNSTEFPYLDFAPVNGKILFAGINEGNPGTPSTISLVRTNIKGNLDTSFGTKGIYSTTIPNSVFANVMITNGRSAYFVGVTWNGTFNELAMVAVKT